MRAIASIMRSSSSSHVSTFILYTSLFIQPDKRSNGVRSGDLGGQLMVLPPIRESVIEMLRHKSGILRRGSVMLKVHSSPCSRRNTF
jgi:hypothetical protein